MGKLKLKAGPVGREEKDIALVDMISCKRANE
jgi:hypothetical protein